MPLLYFEKGDDEYGVRRPDGQNLSDLVAVHDDDPFVSVLGEVAVALNKAGIRPLCD